MDLALAAPDKEDVSGVWTYRIAALEQLNVPIRTSVEPTLDSIRAFGPDLIVIVTGAVPWDAPFPVQYEYSDDSGVGRVAGAGRTCHPQPKVQASRLVGGGMVGIETAECIVRNVQATSQFSKVKARRRQGKPGAQ